MSLQILADTAAYYRNNNLKQGSRRASNTPQVSSNSPAARGAGHRSFSIREASVSICCENGCKGPWAGGDARAIGGGGEGEEGGGWGYQVLWVFSFSFLFLHLFYYYCFCILLFFFWFLASLYIFIYFVSVFLTFFMFDDIFVSIFLFSIYFSISCLDFFSFIFSQFLKRLTCRCCSLCF